MIDPEDLDPESPDPDGHVLVVIDNTYTCGRESRRTAWVPEPPAGVDEGELYEWFDEHVNELTGDGHPCGYSEHAMYEASIAIAPGRAELVGKSSSWEG